VVTSEAQSSFSGKAAEGLLWMTAQKWFSRLAGLLTVVILTRLLTPSDFGLVAIAMSVVPFLYLLADLGFSAYLIQADHPKQVDYSTAFWYSLCAGIAVAAVLGLTGYPLQILLKVDGVVPIMWALAPAVVFVAAGSVPTAILRRRLQFNLIARQAMIGGTVGQIAAVVLALKGFGVWALIFQTLATQLVATLMVWISAKWLPSRAFSIQQFRSMFLYGSNVVAVELIALGRGWAENAIVATALGLNGLGYLSVAQRLIQVSQDLTATAIVPVSTVVFAQVRKDRDRLCSAYERAQSVTYALLTPVMVFIAVCAPVIVPMIFGPQWAESVAPAQALAVAGILTTIASLDHGLLYGLGRPGTWLVYAMAIDALTVTMTFFTAPWGLGAVAVGFIVVALFATVARWPLVAHQLQTSWQRLAAQFGQAVILAIAVSMGGVVAYRASDGYTDVVTLLSTGSAISLGWLFAAHLLFPSAIGEGKRLARRIFEKIRNRAARAQESSTLGDR